MELCCFTFASVIYEGSSFSTFLPTLVLTFLVVAIQVTWWWYLIILICLSVMTDNVKHIFNVCVSHVCTFFKEVSILILCHFFNGLFVFSSLSCEFFIYSGSNTLIWYMISSCFLPFCGLQLYFLDTVFWNKLIYILKVSWFKGGG